MSAQHSDILTDLIHIEHFFWPSAAGTNINCETPAFTVSEQCCKPRSGPAFIIVADLNGWRKDWSIISTLPQRASTGVSVGEKAVLVLKARNR